MINFSHPRSLKRPALSNVKEPSETFSSGWLLTGCTGLVGRFLLREFLRRGEDVCVLVRKRGGITSQQRIEAIVQYWERDLQQHLLRPLVVESNLLEDGLAVSQEDLAKLKGRFPNLLHCAASVRFEMDAQQREPLASNIDGTANLLKFAESIGVKNVHHVSTAYVCGDSTGEVFETPTPTSTQFRNPYEYSKAAAEKLVLDSNFQTKTIYRPSIVIGRYKDGYANAFHTLYSILRFTREVGLPMLDHLAAYVGIDGTEQSNIVSADWVAETIHNITMHPECWNKIYHLTNEEMTSSSDVIASLKNAATRFNADWEKIPQAIGVDLSALDAFNVHLSVYENYFHNDPNFVNYNTRQVPGYVAAPITDRSTLERAFGFAIQQQLKDVTGYHAAAAAPSIIEFATFLNYLAVEAKASDLSCCTKLCLSGVGGGVWHLPLNDALPYELHLPTWAAILVLEKRCNIDAIVDAGLVQSDAPERRSVAQLLEKLFTTYFQNRHNRTTSAGTFQAKFHRVASEN